MDVEDIHTHGYCTTMLAGDVVPVPPAATAAATEAAVYLSVWNSTTSFSVS